MRETAFDVLINPCVRSVCSRSVAVGLITAEKARALGIEAFCMKPLLIRDLGRLVRQVLEQRPAQEA